MRYSFRVHISSRYLAAARKSRSTAGHAKRGGRIAGTPNQIKQIGRETIINLANKLKDGIADDFRRLEPKDRVRFFIELMKFVVPQKSETVVESKSYNEELRKLCEEYENGDTPTVE